METDVTKYHPVGWDMDSYRRSTMVEAVTLEPISEYELMNRYNLLVEAVDQQRKRIAELETMLKS